MQRYRKPAFKRFSLESTEKQSQFCACMCHSGGKNRVWGTSGGQQEPLKVLWDTLDRNLYRIVFPEGVTSFEGRKKAFLGFSRTPGPPERQRASLEVQVYLRCWVRTVPARSIVSLGCNVTHASRNLREGTEGLLKSKQNTYDHTPFLRGWISSSVGWNHKMGPWASLWET